MLQATPPPTQYYVGTGKNRKKSPSDLQLEISGVGSVEPEQPTRPYSHPFERDGGESEDEGLHPRRLFEAETFALEDAQEVPVVVVEEDHEYGVRFHEGARKVAPF